MVEKLLGLVKSRPEQRPLAPHVGEDINLLSNYYADERIEN